MLSVRYIWNMFPPGGELDAKIIYTYILQKIFWIVHFMLQITCDKYRLSIVSKNKHSRKTLWSNIYAFYFHPNMLYTQLCASLTGCIMFFILLLPGRFDLTQCIFFSRAISMPNMHVIFQNLVWKQLIFSIGK